MPIQSLLAFLVIGSAGAASTGTKKQFPFEILPLSLPKEDRQLRGSPPGLDVPFTRVAFGGIPMGAVALNFPEDAEVMQGPPVVDGSLRDLLDLGSALGAAVLRPGGDMAMPSRPAHQSLGGVEGDFGEPLELPLDALHVKMQDQVPKPLSFEDADGKIRIYGTLPKNLTAKTLKVTLSGGDGRNLVVQYFLGQGTDTQNLVGIDERFALDFDPVDQPSVKYKAHTGAFELVLTRPSVTPQKQVAINFDTVPEHLEEAEDLAAAKPSEANDVEAVDAKAADVKDDALPVPGKYHDWASEVLAAKTNEPATVALKRSKPVGQHSGTASPKEFVHESKLTRLPAAQANYLHKVLGASSDGSKDLQKKIADEIKQAIPSMKATGDLHEKLPEVTKELTKVQTNDKAERVQEVRDRAKQFVADAHLGDAQKELINAFAPLDLGLVLLEMHHHVRAH